MGLKVGRDAAVKLGASTIVGQGTWSMNGITLDQLESTSFGDSWKKFVLGMRDGGTLGFNGFYDPADTTGQEALLNYQINGTEVTSLRMYIDNTSYWEPCQTTGYFTPNDVTGNITVKSYALITTASIGADKSGLMTISFEAKVSGCMALV